MKILHIAIVFVFGWITLIGINTATAADIDISGTWNIFMEYRGNMEKAEILMTQKGDTLSGTYNGKFLKSAPIDGSLNGNAFEIRINRKEGSSHIYKGVIDGTKMKGSAHFGGGTLVKDFTGEKQ